jgi:tetratricopeptide (TPR) repeat protein
MQVYPGWHNVCAAHAQVSVPWHPLGSGVHAHEGSCEQHAPESDVPAGQPPSSGAMHAPPETCVRTQISDAPQVATPHAGPAASLGGPDPPLLLQPPAAPVASAASATANAAITPTPEERRLIWPLCHRRALSARRLIDSRSGASKMASSSDLATLVRSVRRKAARIWDQELIRLWGRPRRDEDPRVTADVMLSTLGPRLEGGERLLAVGDLAERLAALERLLQDRIDAEQAALLGDIRLLLDPRAEMAGRAAAARHVTDAPGGLTSEFLLRALAARPLSRSRAAELPAAVARAESAGQSTLRTILRWLQDRQPQIAKVCAAFDRLPLALFGDDERERERWREALAEEGAFRALAFVPSDRTSMAREAARLLTSRGVAPETRHRAIVKAWTDPLVADEAQAGGPPSSAFDWASYGFFADEVNAYNRSYEEDPEPLEPSSNRANLYAIGGWLDDALTEYDAVLAAKPADREARHGRPNMLRRCGRLAEARAAYDALLGDHPADEAAIAGRARVLGLERRFDEALAAYDGILAARPADAAAIRGRAAVLADAGRWDEALAAFDAATGADPHHGGAGFGRVRVLAALGRWDDALAAAPDAWARGMVFLRAGDVIGAEALFAAELASPFDADRDRFRVGLALARLRQRQLATVPGLLAPVDYEPLIPLARAAAAHAHLLAAATTEAAATFARIPTAATPALLEVRAELGRRLAGEPARFDDDQLIDLELGVLESSAF